MAILKRISIALFALSVIVGVSFHASSEAAAVSLAGKLVDPEGRAVKDTGARIIAFREGEVARETSVAGDGRYELPLTPGQWILFLVVKPETGFLAPDVKRITLNETSGAYTWNPVLERAEGVIVGSLENEAGNHLGKALVNVVNLVTGKISSSLEVSNGGYGIPVPKGTYSIEAFSEDGGVVNPAAEQRTINSGFADLKMVFRNSDGTISGEIGGVPAGSKVSVAAWSDAGHESSVNADYVLNTYRYTLKVKRNDTWHLKAAAAGPDGKIYESVEYVVLVDTSAVKTQNFLLLPSSSPTLPLNRAQTIAPQGGTLSLQNGMLVSIPRQPGNDSGVSVSISPTFIASVNQNLIGPAYKIEASVAGTRLDKIGSGMVVGIPYNDTDLARANIKNVAHLRLSIWDELARAWRTVPTSSVDPIKKMVYGYTEYLALLGVGGDSGADTTPPPPPPASDTVDTSSSSGSGSSAPASTPAPQGVTAPTNVTVTATQSGFLLIRWFDFILKAGEVHDIERASGNSQDFIRIAQDVQSPFTDLTVQPGATYRYRVVARDAQGLTAPSTSEIGTAPSDARAPIVTGIVSVVQEKNAALSITSDEQAILAVRCVPDSGTGSSAEVLLTNLVQAATVGLNNLSAGTAYTCNITGTDSSGNTSKPVQVSMKTLGVLVSTQPVTPPQTSPATQPTTPVATPSFTFTRNLSFGSTGTDVRALQQFLVARGDLRVTTTTQFFGNATRAALIRFQIRNGLPGTGTLTPQTITLINSRSFR